MFNLLGNAIKFTPAGGKVAVFIERINNHVQISISDTGIGIPPNIQDDIFSPFVQADSSNTRKYGVTGLGLFLVKQFVEMPNGKIWLESEGGKGSTFTFTIGNQEPIVGSET
jgi:signal transduction histidine kinase